MEYYLVANFKEYKTTAEVLTWLTRVGPKIDDNHVHVIIAPQFPSLAEAKAALVPYHGIALAAQDVGRDEHGAYTGEVTAESLHDYVSYTIVGHSERRRLFGETAHDVKEKVAQLLGHGIMPIVCLSDETLAEAATYTGQSVLVAYEPLRFIGAGQAQDPTQTATVVSNIRDQVGGAIPILYGGSVDGQNAKTILEKTGVSGFLVGSASLQPEDFLAIYHGIRQN